MEGGYFSLSEVCSQVRNDAKLNTVNGIHYALCARKRRKEE